MAEVLLIHHIQGLTDGVRAFADDLRAGGHTVHVPDLYDGHTFATIEEGFAFARSAGLDRIRELRQMATEDQEDLEADANRVHGQSFVGVRGTTGTG